MPLHRIRIELSAPLGTPLTSGTIFGHLCWAFRDSHGEAALESWLRTLPENPWMISDGLPADHLPRPLIPPPPASSEPPGKMTREKLAALDRDKERRLLAFLPAARWRDIRVGLSAAKCDAHACGPRSLAAHRIAHNTIDRATAATPETAGLWFVDEFWPYPESPAVDIYARAPAAAEEIRALFSAVGDAGYGRDASTGRGRFAVVAIDPAGELDAPPAGGGTPRLLSLSHACLSANMRDACYKLTTHFGKVGRSMLASVARPWKLPILLARPGATFIPDDAGPFGAWLTGVHQDRPEIGHNAWHLAIPFTLAGHA